MKSFIASHISHARTLLLLICYSVVAAQKIVIHPHSCNTSETGCNGSGRDCPIDGEQVEFLGFIDATGLDLRKWPLADISISIKMNASSKFGLKKLCTPYLSNCGHNQPKMCFCQSRNGSVYYIALHDIANESKCNAVLRGEWWSKKTSRLYIGSPQKYPSISKPRDKTSKDKKLNVDLIWSLLAYLMTVAVACLQLAVVTVTVYKIWNINRGRMPIPRSWGVVSTQDKKNDTAEIEFSHSDTAVDSYSGTSVDTTPKRMTGGKDVTRQKGK